MFSPDNSILVVIDIQGKLAQIMYERDSVLGNAAKLIQAANLLEIPVIATEQAPEKIGSTIPEISKHLNNHPLIAKTSFSCCGEDEFIQKVLEYNRKEIVIAGIEAHVCVYQTVCGLVVKGFDVQVVADAVSSRTQENKILALERIKMNGASLTSTEMIICELLKSSEHPQFKEVMSLIK